jgi:class 3 adenylate cyclase
MLIAETWKDDASGITREVQNATVLFADICGSTHLCYRLGDESARSIVGAGMHLIMSVVEGYGGRIVKTLGDEVMCLFPDPDHGAAAATEMQRRTVERQHEGVPLDIHIGMQHGPVLLEGRDVFGDTVNAASYLCAVATSGQILTTDTTIRHLSEQWRPNSRPLFFAVIKGSSVESAIHQIIWQGDTSTLTDVNLRRHNLAPPDDGGALIIHGNTEIRIDPRRPEIVLGRDEQCDIRVADTFASRRHARIVLRRTQIHLIDLSVNGTFVRRVTGEASHVFRTELILDGAGQLSLGRAFDQPDVEVIQFRRDRRAMYRP